MTTDPKPLNKLEIWVAEHSAPIFVTIAVLIVIGAGVTFWIWHAQDDTQDQVNVLRPQVTRINKAVCDRRSLEREDRAAACAQRIRIGLINCRRAPRCRAALLAAITYPSPARKSAPTTTATTTAPSSEGVVPQPSDNGHQQPGPGDPGHDGGGHQSKGQGSPPAPSPGLSPAPGGSVAPEVAPPAETPGNGAQDGSTSGLDVEVCAVERTCVGVEVDVDPKGLTP